MQNIKPTQVTFRHLSPTPALAELAEREAEHLAVHRPPIIAVRVAIERPHRRRRNGAPIRVSVELAIPGRILVARARHVDARAAIHDAFDAAERAIRSHRGRRRGLRQRVVLPWGTAA